MPFCEGVLLEEVYFRYDDDREYPALSAIRLDIPRGRTVALVGPSGSGKSTLADIVGGMLTPTVGRVVIDGVRLAVDRQADWREQVGYVSQDVFLLHDTIRDNLLWAWPEASEEELHAALAMADADALLARLPAGLDTVVGDRGVLLSAGERQRLAIARALLRRPAVLILDEATGNLDPESDLRIRAAIESLHGRVTILLITHRLGSVLGADAIHVLEGGRIVESGTWRTLMGAGDSRFRAMALAQGFQQLLRPDEEDPVPPVPATRLRIPGSPAARALAGGWEDPVGIPDFLPEDEDARP